MIAFKVKITHPRVYKVRPNYGVILPGESKQLTITLVEPTREDLLLLTCEKHGEAAAALGWQHQKRKLLIR